MALKLLYNMYKFSKSYVNFILTTEFFILNSIFNFLLDKNNFLGIIYYSSLHA